MFEAWFCLMNLVLGDGFDLAIMGYFFMKSPGLQWMADKLLALSL